MKNDFNRKDRNRLVIISLIAIVIVLVCVIGWVVIANPAIDKYILEKQQEAYAQGQGAVIQEILSQVERQGFVQIPISDTQSVVLDLRMPEQTA